MKCLSSLVPPLSSCSSYGFQFSVAASQLPSSTSWSWGGLVVCEEKYYHFMKMAVAPKFYFPSSCMYGNVLCCFFFKCSFSLVIAQKSNAIQSNKRSQKVYTWSSPKCTQEEKKFTTSGHCHSQITCLLNKILISHLLKLFTVYTSPVKFFLIIYQVSQVVIQLLKFHMAKKLC